MDDNVFTLQPWKTPYRAIRMFVRTSGTATQVSATAWSAATAYVYGDLVSLGAATYFCILANTNQTPPNATYWQAVPYAYAWQQQVQNPAGAFIPDTNGQSGTPTTYPLYMADASTAVASGTICEAEIEYGGWLIGWPVGGSGNASTYLATTTSTISARAGAQFGQGTAELKKIPGGLLTDAARAVTVWNKFTPGHAIPVGVDVSLDVDSETGNYWIVEPDKTFRNKCIGGFLVGVSSVNGGLTYAYDAAYTAEIGCIPCPVCGSGSGSVDCPSAATDCPSLALAASAMWVQIPGLGVGTDTLGFCADLASPVQMNWLGNCDWLSGLCWVAALPNSLHPQFGHSYSTFSGAPGPGYYFGLQSGTADQGGALYWASGAGWDGFSPLVMQFLPEGAAVGDCTGWPSTITIYPCAPGSGSGSGSGSDGGCSAVVGTGEGSGVSAGLVTTYNLLNIVSANNSILQVWVYAVNLTSPLSVTATYAPGTLISSQGSVNSGAGLTGFLFRMNFLVTTGGTADVVITVGAASQILAQAIDVTGLAGNAEDSHTFNTGNSSTPDTTITAFSTGACDWAAAGAGMIGPTASAPFAWLNGFTNTGQDTSTTLAGQTLALSVAGQVIASATTVDGLMVANVTTAWVAWADLLK